MNYYHKPSHLERLPKLVMLMFVLTLYTGFMWTNWRNISMNPVVWKGDFPRLVTDQIERATVQVLAGGPASKSRRPSATGVIIGRERTAGVTTVYVVTRLSCVRPHEQLTLVYHSELNAESEFDRWPCELDVFDEEKDLALLKCRVTCLDGLGLYSASVRRPRYPEVFPISVYGYGFSVGDGWDGEKRGVVTSFCSNLRGSMSASSAELLELPKARFYRITRSLDHRGNDSLSGTPLIDRDGCLTAIWMQHEVNSIYAMRVQEIADFVDQHDRSEVLYHGEI